MLPSLRKGKRKPPRPCLHPRSRQRCPLGESSARDPGEAKEFTSSSLGCGRKIGELNYRSLFLQGWWDSAGEAGQGL